MRRSDMGLDSLQGREIRISSFYAGASVFKEAFCAGVECQAT